MRLSEELRDALTEWRKTADGYEVETTKGLAKIFSKKGKRGGKKWFIEVDGKEHALGRRGSFDHAEGVLVSIGAKQK